MDGLDDQTEMFWKVAGGGGRPWGRVTDLGRRV